MGSKGALQTPNSSPGCVGTMPSIGRWAEGGGTSRLPDGRSCRNPLPTAIDSQGALESPPLAKMAQGEVLTLSMPKDE